MDVVTLDCWDVLLDDVWFKLTTGVSVWTIALVVFSRFVAVVVVVTVKPRK